MKTKTKQYLLIVGLLAVAVGGWALLSSPSQQDKAMFQTQSVSDLGMKTSPTTRGTTIETDGIDKKGGTQIEALQKALAGVSDEKTKQQILEQAKSKALVSCATQTLIPEIECESLIDLFFNTSGQSWNDNTNWLDVANINQRVGVWIENNHVTSIYLYDNNLFGTLPESIGNFSRLQNLSLPANKLYGEIPQTINHINTPLLTYIILGQNELTGFIPRGIRQLPNLEQLNLHGNKLSGPICRHPYDCFSNSLKSIDLGYNKFSGLIPSAVLASPQLEHFIVNHNQLCGTLPHLAGEGPWTGTGTPPWDFLFWYFNNNLTVSPTDPTRDTQTPQNCPQQLQDCMNNPEQCYEKTAEVDGDKIHYTIKGVIMPHTRILVNDRIIWNYVTYNRDTGQWNNPNANWDYANGIGDATLLGSANVAPSTTLMPGILEGEFLSYSTEGFVYYIMNPTDAVQNFSLQISSIRHEELPNSHPVCNVAEFSVYQSLDYNPEDNSYVRLNDDFVDNVCTCGEGYLYNEDTEQCDPVAACEGIDSTLALDFDGNGVANNADLEYMRARILGIVVDTPQSCDGTMISMGTNSFCCREGRACDVTCDGKVSTFDIGQAGRWMTQGLPTTICGVNVCE